MNEKKEIVKIFDIMSTASIIYGIILIIISMLIFTNTRETYVAVTTLLGVYLVVKGFIDFFTIFSNHNSHRGITLFASIIILLAGFFVISAPLFTAIVITSFVIYVIGFSFILGGIISFKESIPMAIINIIIGMLMFFFTKETAIAFSWLIAVLLLFSGIVTIIFGATTKNVVREING